MLSSSEKSARYINAFLPAVELIVRFCSETILKIEWPPVFIPRKKDNYRWVGKNVLALKVHVGKMARQE